MPSPFPGMDPFLESPEYFPDLHDSLVYNMQELLQPRLPAGYFAKKARRVWLEHVERPVGPDVYVVHHRHSEHGPGAGVEIATLAETGPVVVVAEPPPLIEIREPYLEIYTGRGQTKRLVTSIEVLSPANKSSAGQGRGLYLQEQQEVLAAEVHLIEIDLLRGGQHTTAVPRDRAIEQTGAFDYHVSLHCFSEPNRFYVYPIRLQERLPVIAVPLLPGDPTVTVDLQTAFDRSYNAGPFRREIDYRNETPEPSLSPEQQAWVRQVLDPAAGTN
jgi:hypothetical protein